MQPQGPPFPPPFGPPPPPYLPQMPAPNDSKAVASLVLGVFAIMGVFCYVGLFAGLPAVILGALALGTIKRSGGTVGGTGMAVAGIVMGSFGILVFVAQIALVVGLFAFGAMSQSSPPSPGPRAYPTAMTSPSADAGYGAIHVVDLDSSDGPLREQLVEQWSEAKREGEALLVQTTAAWCMACHEIDLALRDAAMQSALSHVRLVRVDIDEFGAELAPLKLEQKTVPWFYLLDAKARLVDAISADEWDENVAENIAPVLEDFTHGRLSGRRVPRPGSTAL